LVRNSEYQPASTFVVSSLFSACVIALVGDLTATRNGGSYLTTLTAGWGASVLTAALANNIYSGKSESVRFIVTVVPSVASIVLINHLFFDPNQKIKNNYGSILDLIENCTPVFNSKFIGINFNKIF
jgi:hypothetical protein